jgi:hypothetical protein
VRGCFIKPSGWSVSRSGQGLDNLPSIDKKPYRWVVLLCFQQAWEKRLPVTLGALFLLVYRQNEE